MKKAGFYVRVSTGRQEKEATAESQIDELEREIAKDGNILLPNHRYIDDGWTGELLIRPEIDKMRDAAKNGDFDILYVYDRGRIARDFVYQEIVIGELGDLGIEFKSLHDINAANPEEKVLQSMQGVFHEYERIKIAERMRRGKLYKTRKGELLGYNAPYGYSYIPKSGTENGYFVINEEEAEVVRKIFNWIGNESYTIRRVIKKLYEEEIPPQKGKKEYWVKSVIDRLVRNRTYIGEHHYNKTEAVIPKKTLTDNKYKKVKRCSRKMKPKEEWIECKVPAIIDEALFNKVQTQLEENSKFANRNKRHDYLLNGLIKCNCGMNRVGQPSGTQFYYRCSERIYKYPLKPACQEKGINADVLDAVVWERISKMLTSKQELKKQAKRWLCSKEKTTDNQGDIEKIMAGLTSLDTEEERY
jgi:site-specific DNA recombinase